MNTKNFKLRLLFVLKSSNLLRQRWKESAIQTKSFLDGIKNYKNVRTEIENCSFKLSEEPDKDIAQLVKDFSTAERIREKLVTSLNKIIGDNGDQETVLKIVKNVHKSEVNNMLATDILIQGMSSKDLRESAANERAKDFVALENLLLQITTHSGKTIEIIKNKLVDIDSKINSMSRQLTAIHLLRPPAPADKTKLRVQ